MVVSLKPGLMLVSSHLVPPTHQCVSVKVSPTGTTDMFDCPVNTFKTLSFHFWLLVLNSSNWEIVRPSKHQHQRETNNSHSWQQVIHHF